MTNVAEDELLRIYFKQPAQFHNFFEERDPRNNCICFGKGEVLRHIFGNLQYEINIQFSRAALAPSPPLLFEIN